MKIYRKVLTVLMLALVFPLTANSKSYPDHPIKLIVPFAVGGLNDILARSIAPKLGEELGVSVIVENKGGAGSNLGTAYVARAKPDGYTLLLTGASLAINPNLYKDLSYDVKRDLESIIQMSTTQMVVLSSPSLEVDSVAELVNYAKENPGKLNFPSSGVGSPSQLASELFVRTYGLEATHIPYTGAGPALISLASGETDFGVDVLPTALPAHKSGTVNILAVISNERLSSLPDVPTLAEAGFPEFSASSWNVIAAPKGISSDIIEKLRAALINVMKTESIREHFSQLAVAPEMVVGDDLDAFIEQETEKWGNVITQANIVVN